MRTPLSDVYGAGDVQPNVAIDAQAGIQAAVGLQRVVDSYRGGAMGKGCTRSAGRTYLADSARLQDRRRK